MILVLRCRVKEALPTTSGDVRPHTSRRCEKLLVVCADSKSALGLLAGGARSTRAWGRGLTDERTVLVAGTAVAQGALRLSGDPRGNIGWAFVLDNDASALRRTEVARDALNLDSSFIGHASSGWVSVVA